jgi:TetR/AcrR family transcriptional regulator, regulator of autoinduction and epiphytic fitness
MPSPVKARRVYDSPRRREQARATRRSILGSAQRLFVEQGYVATTIDAIAAHAGVSPETVYATFKHKRTILTDLLDIAIAGDDAPVPILEREWVQAMRDEPDPGRRLRILARNGRLILERTAAIYEVLRGAASSDPLMASVWEQHKSQRFAGQRELVRVLTNGHPLHNGLTARSAVDEVFAIGSPETYRLLVIDRGWSPGRFERWYADTLERLLW